MLDPLASSSLLPDPALGQLNLALQLAHACREDGLRKPGGGLDNAGTATANHQGFRGGP